MCSQESSLAYLQYLCIVQACGGGGRGEGYFEFFKNLDIMAPSLGCLFLLKMSLKGMGKAEKG